MTWLRAALSMGFVAALFWVFAPAHVKDRVVGVATFATNERQCFNFNKKGFGDPDTAYLVSSRIWTRENEQEYNKDKPDPIFEKYESVLMVEARAKNPMGGYVSVSLGCPLVHGEFNDMAAGIYRFEKAFQE